jgi:hypothetical protein
MLRPLLLRPPLPQRLMLVLLLSAGVSRLPTGAIDGEWDRCRAVLECFQHDEDLCVAESCIVALDAMEYWDEEAGNEANASGGGDHDEEDDVPARAVARNGTFKRLKEQLIASPAAAVSAANALGGGGGGGGGDVRGGDDNDSVAPAVPPPRTLTASTMEVRHAAYVMLVLQRALANASPDGGGVGGAGGAIVAVPAAGGAAGIGDGGGGDADDTAPSVATTVAQRVLLSAVGKLKRKGFYVDQERGRMNFDGEGLLVGCRT